MKVFEDYLAAFGLVADKWTEPNSNGWVNPYIDGKSHFGFRKIEGGFEVNDFREGKISIIKDGQVIPKPPVKVEKPVCDDFLKEFNIAKKNKTKHISKRLTDKGVSQRAAFMYNNNLHIPYYEKVGGEVIGCQVQSEDGKKWSIKGSKMTGAFTILQKHSALNNSRSMGLIAEGYTTASQLADLFPNALVACAAGMGNLYKVYETLLKAYPKVALVVALDKAKAFTRHKPLNEVVTKFNKAGVPYIQPDLYDTRLNEDTDFNDMVLRIGKEDTQRYIMRVYRTEAPLMPEILPRDGENHVILSHHKGGIISISASQENSIYKAISPAARREFVRLRFNDDDVKKAYVVQQLVKELLHQNNHTNGDIQKGIGGYHEGGNYIFNFIGGRYRLDRDRNLLYEPHYRPIGTNYYVDITANKPLSLTNNVKLNMNDYNELVTLFAKIYPDPTSLFAGLGHLIQASYAGFSDFRGHMWVTGPTGSGKSLLRAILSSLGSGLVSTVQDVSKAGLAQHLNPLGYTNSVAVLADECAADTVAKKKNIGDVIKIMREMSTATEGTISLRGTAEQKVKVYHLRASVYLASTSSYIDDYQDKSRIFEVDINQPVKRHTQDVEARYTLARK